MPSILSWAARLQCQYVTVTLQRWGLISSCATFFVAFSAGITSCQGCGRWLFKDKTTVSRLDQVKIPVSWDNVACWVLLFTGKQMFLRLDITNIVFG